MSSFEIIPGDPASKVILHVPHSSTYVPEDVRAGILLDDDALAAELAEITDANTDEIAIGAAEQTGIRPWLFVNRTSRLVLDPERFPDEREELNVIGRGAVYLTTTELGMFRDPSEAERADLIERFFVPYSDSIAQLVRERLEAVGKVTIVDVHSYPLKKHTYELHGDGPRPEICIGTDSFHTPPSLAEATVEAMKSAAPNGDLAFDSPFAGCYVPLDQYGSNPNVQAVMLEVRRDVVANHMSALQVATGELIRRIDSDLLP